MALRQPSTWAFSTMSWIQIKHLPPTKSTSQDSVFCVYIYDFDSLSCQQYSSATDGKCFQRWICPLQNPSCFSFISVTQISDINWCWNWNQPLCSGGCCLTFLYLFPSPRGSDSTQQQQTAFWRATSFPVMSVCPLFLWIDYSFSSAVNY